MPAVRKVSNRLAHISAYSHVEDHFRERTVYGGLVSLCGALVALVLVVSETYRCLRYTVQQEMVVDMSRESSLHIDFNITFPALPCRTLRMTLGDSSGNFETESIMEQVHHGEIHKWQLNDHGERLLRQEFVRPRGVDSPFILTLDYKDMKTMRDEIIKHHGCNIFGWLRVRRVAGSVQFSVRQEAMLASEEDITTMEAIVKRYQTLGGSRDHPDALALNASHIIHTFRFDGQGAQEKFPLEGISRIDRKATGFDKYFIKVVPFTRTSLWGRESKGHDYSITEYYSRIQPGTRMLPGVVFLYDIWPVRVLQSINRLGFLHLLVRLCAVCGGVWTTTGIIERVFHAVLSKKNAIVRRLSTPSSRND